VLHPEIAAFYATRPSEKQRASDERVSEALSRIGLAEDEGQRWRGVSLDVCPASGSNEVAAALADAFALTKRVAVGQVAALLEDPAAP
jgi:hypothetical protein